MGFTREQLRDMGFPEIAAGHAALPHPSWPCAKAIDAAAVDEAGDAP